MRVPFESDIKTYPLAIAEHLHKRKLERRYSILMDIYVKRWMATNPVVPDLTEAPEGWYKEFPEARLAIAGEGPYWKSVYTRGMQGYKHRGFNKPIPCLNWDEWIKQQGKVGKKKASLSQSLDGFLAGQGYDPDKIPEEDGYEDVDGHPGSLDLPEVKVSKPPLPVVLDYWKACERWSNAKGFSLRKKWRERAQSILSVMNARAQKLAINDPRNTLRDNLYDE